MAATPTDGQKGSPDICVIELGGTVSILTQLKYYNHAIIGLFSALWTNRFVSIQVGDIESMPFIEALRQFQFRVGRENCLFIHVALVPVLGSVGEQKTKPAQHSVRELRALGLK